MAMNGNGRASSISPVSSSVTSSRGTKPPPPVRPKPKRTITAPILMTSRPEFNVIDETKSVIDLPQDTGTPDTSTTPLPVKGTVKALAERFDLTRTPVVTPTSASVVKLTAEIFESNKETKRQRISPVSGGGSSSTLLRFPKPTPPGRRQTTSLNEPNGGIKTTKETENEDDFLRYHSGSAFTSVAGKRDSLERRRRQITEQRPKRAVNDAITLSNGVSRHQGAFIIHDRDRRRLTRSRSCNVDFDQRSTTVASRTMKASIRDRRNSIDGSDVPLRAPTTRKVSPKTAKKTAPPAVPPKPAKKLSMMAASMHEYAEYDVLPSGSPSVLGPPVSSRNQVEEWKRRSLPAADRQFRQLPETPPVPSGSILPALLSDIPGCHSVGTPSSATLATMELLEDSQLNISGHIYCAVRHGEVVDDDDFIVNRMLSDGGIKNGCSKEDDDETSFSAAVFGAIEIAMGKRTATDRNGHRVVEEDAVTNYEEIMEDLPESDVPDAEDETTVDPKLPVSFVQADEKTVMDHSSKWETCSSLTSTSAESGSSCTNVQAPMLIAFRRRSSNDRQSEKNRDTATTDCTLTEDGFHSLDDPTPTQTLKSYSPCMVEKRDREARSAPRSAAPRMSRQTRPKSQLDLAANSLWRIKSDIQLNLSQAMGKIRLKVSSSGSSVSASNGAGQSPGAGKATMSSSPVPINDAIGPKKAEQKARSTFYLPSASAAENLSSKAAAHPTSISITLEAGLGDDLVSSIAASSDEDDDDDEEFDGAWGDNERRVGELDDTTPTASGTGPNLPDLVPQGSRKLESVFGEDDLATTDSSSPTTTTTEGTVSNSSVPPLAQGANRPPLVSESSCSSTVASGLAELERFELVYNSRFAFSEPLYQHYRSQTSMVQRNQTFSEGDGKGTMSRREKLLSTSQLGSQRTLWCELPEVRGAGLLQRMSDEERKLQEAMFEVITSEASYLRSLNILITQFMASPQLSGNTSLGSCITKQERKQLFSNILSVRDCSERFLCTLESRLEENVVLEDVCDLLYEQLRRDCEIYVKYCSNQIYQERTLNDLRRTNPEFRQVVGQLETNPVCECLNLRSFLMLPMQRVTRYPLLIAAILQRAEENSQRHSTAQRAYGMAGRVVRQCNEGAKRLERIEQLVELDKSLVYREGGPKRVALVSGSRWIIKKGAVVHLVPRRHTLGVRGGLRHRRVCLFLFTDLLLITKPVEGEKRFVVKDYCQRQFVEVTPLEPSCPQVPEGSNVSANACLILCTLMKNHRGRQVELIMNCETETDKTRWLEAIRPPCSQEDGAERIYEPWDCPQVRVVREYRAVQEDELELEVGEIINVLRKMPDGWYEGERLRDGEKGWFPGNVTEEILSDHIRAKNYRDRLRFIHEAEMIQRSICMGDPSTSGLPSATGTNSRRNSIIPTAAKALFRF